MRDLTGAALLCGLSVMATGSLISMVQLVRMRSARTIWPIIGWLLAFVVSVVGFVYLFL